MITNVYWLIPSLEANCGCSASQLNLNMAWISELASVKYECS